MIVMMVIDTIASKCVLLLLVAPLYSQSQAASGGYIRPSKLSSSSSAVNSMKNGGPGTKSSTVDIFPYFFCWYWWSHLIFHNLQFVFYVHLLHCACPYCCLFLKNHTTNFWLGKFQLSPTKLNEYVLCFFFYSIGLIIHSYKSSILVYFFESLHLLSSQYQLITEPCCM